MEASHVCFSDTTTNFACFQAPEMPVLILLDKMDRIPYLLDRIAHLRKCSRNDQRVLIAVAGGPGSGKSTLCTALLQHAQEQELYDIIAVPMVSFDLATIIS